MVNRVSRAGTQIPAVELAELRDSSVERIETADLFAGRRSSAEPIRWERTCSSAAATVPRARPCSSEMGDARISGYAG
jgi:hypothetical protein